MNLVRMVAVVFFAIALALSSAVSAEAASARVTGSVQVRSGPGNSYRVVGRLHRGDRVDVNRCSSSRRWCHVSSRHTRSGWVNSRFLDRVSGRGSSRGGVCFYGARGYVCLGR
ncbi:MAG: SH3 domain-containing protein [Rhizobiaceae bacterium]|nr:SH3 domain-containing protein [Rhizobiaceae bacterium]